MNVIEAIGVIRSAGGRVTVEGENLKVVAPAGTITQGVAEALAGSKAELIALLAPSDAEIEREARSWLARISHHPY